MFAEVTINLILIGLGYGCYLILERVAERSGYVMFSLFGACLATHLIIRKQKFQLHYEIADNPDIFQSHKKILKKDWDYYEFLQKHEAHRDHAYDEFRQSNGYAFHNFGLISMLMAVALVFVFIASFQVGVWILVGYLTYPIYRTVVVALDYYFGNGSVYFTSYVINSIMNCKQDA